MSKFSKTAIMKLSSLYLFSKGTGGGFHSKNRTNQKRKTWYLEIKKFNIEEMQRKYLR
jgi:hypothetical protein